MKKKRQSFGRVVNQQWDREFSTSKNYDGEASAYWDWIHSHADSNSVDGELTEATQANPDVLADNDTYAAMRSTYQDMIDNAYKDFSMREKQVFYHLSRGMSEEEIAQKLKIERTSVKSYRERIKNKFLKLADKEA